MTLSVVRDTANRMSPADYEGERARPREACGDGKAEAGARFEQELAKLFYRSGWTQEMLAAKEGKSAGWICQKLRFGRFLGFLTKVRKRETPSLRG